MRHVWEVVRRLVFVGVVVGVVLLVALVGLSRTTGLMGRPSPRL